MYPSWTVRKGNKYYFVLSELMFCIMSSSFKHASSAYLVNWQFLAEKVCSGDEIFRIIILCSYMVMLFLSDPFFLNCPILITSLWVIKMNDQRQKSLWFAYHHYEPNSWKYKIFYIFKMDLNISTLWGDNMLCMSTCSSNLLMVWPIFVKLVTKDHAIFKFMYLNISNTTSMQISIVNIWERNSSIIQCNILKLNDSGSGTWLFNWYVMKLMKFAYGTQ
jgi:hypothetical protein